MKEENEYNHRWTHEIVFSGWVNEPALSIEGLLDEFIRGRRGIKRPLRRVEMTKGGDKTIDFILHPVLSEGEGIEFFGCVSVTPRVGKSLIEGVCFLPQFPWGKNYLVRLGRHLGCELSDKYRDSGHYSFSPEDREREVLKFRKARRKGEIDNIEAWCKSRPGGYSSRTLGRWRKQFPE